MNNSIWILAYFCQHYGGRVEIDEAGREYVVEVREAMEREHLHLAWSRDGRHFSALNDNRPFFRLKEQVPPNNKPVIR